MNAPLDIHEQILLSAWIDGEVSESERAQVQQLLTRPEAQAYVQTLKATRVLVNKHGAVKAPVGLKGRVLAAMDEDFDDISRPTASRESEGKVIALPTASWKTPLLALAAAIVVVLGLAFGPSLFPTTPERTPSDIARETAERAAHSKDPEVGEKAGEKAGKEEGDKSALHLDDAENTKRDGDYAETADLAKKLKDHNELERSRQATEPAKSANDPAFNARKTNPEAAKDGDAREKDQLGSEGTERRNETGPAGKKPELRGGKESKMGSPEPKTGRSDAEGAPGDDRGPAASPPPAPQPPAAPTRPAEPAETGGPQDGANDDKKNGAKNTEEDETLRRVAPKSDDARDQQPQSDPEHKKVEKAPGGGGGGATGRTAQPGQNAGKKPGTEGEESAKEANKEANEEANEDAADANRAEGGAWGKGEAQGAAEATMIELALQPGRALAAQNDVLRVAALYGKAEVLVDESTGTERVVVDLDESRAAELVAALKRLAEQQDYGRVTVPKAMQDEVAKAAGAASETARDTLPSDVKVQIDGTQPEAGAAAKARTRLVIQLK